MSHKGQKFLKIPIDNLQGIYVENPIPETFKEKKKLKSYWYPSNYQTCINFFQVLWKMMKLPGGVLRLII